MVFQYCLAVRQQIRYQNSLIFSAYLINLYEKRGIVVVNRILSYLDKWL
jgi:hypothetical protein